MESRLTCLDSSFAPVLCAGPNDDDAITENMAATRFVGVDRNEVGQEMEKVSLRWNWILTSMVVVVFDSGADGNAETDGDERPVGLQGF